LARLVVRVLRALITLWEDLLPSIADDDLDCDELARWDDVLSG
jgi:hypothetical protein